MRHLLWLLPVPLLAVASPASARPVAPGVFCGAYPDAPMCLADGQAPCETCHLQAPSLNAFGARVEDGLVAQAGVLDDAAFQAHLAAVLASLELEDADGDGYTNVDEIAAGSYPGDVMSTPLEATCPESVDALPYKICQYDTRFAFSRVWLDFCGFRPSYEEIQSFEALDEDGRRTVLHKVLDGCLASEFWRGMDGVVWQLANRKIRPVRSLNGALGADYEVDYALFAWAHIDGHDVREVLTAQYFVRFVKPKDGSGLGVTEYFKVPGMDGQPMQQEYRVGMLSTSWFLLFNTMFTAVPRATAAQALRSYLNLDIARLEGLSPVAGEPVDYDGSGVDAAGCATCHSTLDPLTYPFTRYNGIQLPFFTYDPARMQELALQKPSLGDVPEQGMLLGQPVSDLRDWVQVASNSDPFYQAVTEDYWTMLVGEAPSKEHADLFAQYESVWQSLRGDPAHSVNAMLHNLIDTEAYGAP